MNYHEIVRCRRALKIDGYSTLAEVGFDWRCVTPYQKASRSPSGPVLVAYNWLDAPSVEVHRATLQELGYLPGIPFNNVLDQALDLAGMSREQLYVTQAFHLLPDGRSANVSRWAIDLSFDSVTRHELVDRYVIALGGAASDACRRHGINHVAAPHPSARGLAYAAKAAALAKLILGRE